MTNCVNCAAPVDGAKCKYCGTLNRLSITNLSDERIIIKMPVGLAFRRPDAIKYWGIVKSDQS